MILERNPMLLKEDQQFLEEIGGFYDNYSYLEVGVYQGRSLPFQLIRDSCTRVMAVDLFPETYKDERHFDHTDQPNWEKVYKFLKSRNVPIDVLEHFHGDIKDLPVNGTYDIAFIDAEHTNEAAFRDALNVMKHMTRNGVIIFHDTTLVYGAIDCFNSWLEHMGYQSKMYKIKGSELSVFVLGNNPKVSDLCKKHKQDYEKFKFNAKMRLAFNLIAKNPKIDIAKFFTRH